ncbi:DUF2946 domain-containing protein [Entomomonas moraniae]|uniref:DUF2946 domain-containing protein n=1 Tax=Entomomonas moraniae TaxID=2213226 RepID=A0A3Q9JMI7_9GAMM|nr:DUF2946 domain-containing protein [Entomomonas moraniae]AZS50812.1 DUF2946 domain-containing protein [Entomomonas moraniae]
MLRQKALSRFYAYCGLFAILLIVVCPLITQTIALMAKPSTIKHLYPPPSLSHFECASQFFKENNLDPNDFNPESMKASSHDEDYSQVDMNEHHDMDHGRIVSCGYCDLIHTATILVAFYVVIFNAPSSDVVLVTADPYVFSPNFWSTLTRAPPITLLMS